MGSASVKSGYWQVVTAQRQRWSAFLGELKRELQDNHFGFQEVVFAGDLGSLPKFCLYL